MSAADPGFWSLENACLSLIRGFKKDPQTHANLKGEKVMEMPHSHCSMGPKRLGASPGFTANKLKERQVCVPRHNTSHAIIMQSV